MPTNCYEIRANNAVVGQMYITDVSPTLPGWKIGTVIELRRAFNSPDGTFTLNACNHETNIFQIETPDESVAKNLMETLNLTGVIVEIECRFKK